MKALKKTAIGAAAAFAAMAAGPAYTADALKTDNPAAVASETAPKVFRVAAGQPKGFPVTIEYGPALDKVDMARIAGRLSENCDTTLAPRAKPADALVIDIPAQEIRAWFEAKDIGSAEAFARRNCRPAPAGP